LIILDEFGVDKLSDILDAEESEADFERLYRDALLRPDALGDKIDKYISAIRKRYAQRLSDQDLILEEKELDIGEARRLSQHPLPYWTQIMTLSYITARGGDVTKSPTGYKLVWPDGRAMDNVQFEKGQGITKGLDLNNPRILHILNRIMPQVSGMSIPQIEVGDLSRKVSGYWSLWQITVSNKRTRIRKILPLFVHDDGRIRASTAFQLWDHLLKESTEISFNGSISDAALPEIYGQMRKIAEQQGENQLMQAKKVYENYLRKSREKNKSYYDLRKRALSRIPDGKPLTLRIDELEAARKKWLNELERNEKPILDLHTFIIAHVRGIND